MQIRGIVQRATLEENPPGSDRIEMILLIQGVGPDQPRRLVVPFGLLIQDPSLDPDLIRGRAFHADVSQDDSRRWVVIEIAFAEERILRAEEQEEESS